MMQSASRESSPITSDSRRSAILLRGILSIARSHFEHMVDERYARPVLLMRPESPSYGCSADCCASRHLLDGKVQPMRL